MYKKTTGRKFTEEDTRKNKKPCLGLLETLVTFLDVAVYLCCPSGFACMMLFQNWLRPLTQIYCDIAHASKQM